VHADFFSAIDGLVECLRLHDDGPAHDASGSPVADSDLAASASSCGSGGSSTRTDAYAGFNLFELTSPLHKNILPHTVNILR
jgi:hypothetical protein